MNFASDCLETQDAIVPVLWIYEISDEKLKKVCAKAGVKVFDLSSAE